MDSGKQATCTRIYQLDVGQELQVGAYRVRVDATEGGGRKVKLVVVKLPDVYAVRQSPLDKTGELSQE